MSNWAIFGIAGLVILYLLWLYNSLIGLRNRVRNAWAQIDVQLKRRHDLIPNLLESVKGYMAHERGIMEQVSLARQNAIAAGSDVAARVTAEDALSRSVRSLFAVAEAYPQLRASENMLRFQEELSSTENRISFARQHYNDATMEYNTAIQTVPRNLLAGLSSLRPEVLFTTEEADRQPVAVKFSRGVRTFSDSPNT
jgi:LemA protein